MMTYEFRIVTRKPHSFHICFSLPFFVMFAKRCQECIGFKRFEDSLSYLPPALCSQDGDIEAIYIHARSPIDRSGI